MKYMNNSKMIRIRHKVAKRNDEFVKLKNQNSNA